jgi:redox-sensitive bicupin YhaK (pirin superfamily)
VLDGVLEHQDSMGTGAQIRPGELQRMTAGTGVTHSEFNASNSEPVHFLQIWILPERAGLQPGYEQRSFAPSELNNQWRLVASGKPRDGAVKIHHDVDLYVARLTATQALDYAPALNRRLWLQVTRGSVEVDGATMAAGDGASWINADGLRVIAQDDAEVLLFDMTP